MTRPTQIGVVATVRGSDTASEPAKSDKDRIKVLKIAPKKAKQCHAM